MRSFSLCLAIFLLIPICLISWACSEYEKEKLQFAKDYNALAIEKHLPTIPPSEFSTLTHDDIKHMYIKIKYGVDVPQNKVVPLYIYSGS